MAIFAFLSYFFFSPPVGPETYVMQCGTDPDGNFRCVEIYIPDGNDACTIWFNEGSESDHSGGIDNGGC